MEGKGTIRHFPLLQSQMSVFMGWEIHPTATAWNLPSVITFPKTVGADRLEAFMRRLVENQELHIRFVKGDDGLPRQFADSQMAIPIVRRQMSDEAATAYMNNDFVRPFTPYGDQPLCRFEIIETPTQLLLLSDFHHTIADGTSIVRLFNENQNQNQNASTPPLFQAALDEESSLTTPRYRESRTTMLEKFKGVSFPTLTRNTAHAWGHHLLTTQSIDRNNIDHWCRRHAVDANHLLMAAFSIALSKLTRQQEVAFFILNHGRTNRQLRQAFGMFVRSLPVLLAVDGKQTVIDFIKNVRHELRNTWRNSIYPSTHLCRDLQIKPTITFGFQSDAIEETFTLDGERYPGRQLNHGDVCNDLNATIYIHDGNYEIRIDASAALYNVETLQMVATCMKTSVEQMMAAPMCMLKDIALVSDNEQQRLIALGKGEHFEYDETQTWLQLFEEQVRRTPHASALICQDGRLTYQELNEQATTYAHQLIADRNRKSPFVIVTANRNKEFMVQVIGIWKAGYAYVPVDPTWPEARRQQIIEDALNAQPTLLVPSLPHSLAYMMYTSGSTGKPKGVMVTHRGLVNLTHFIVRHWHLTAQSRISCHSPFTFDASVEDLFPVLTTGGTLYIIPDDIRMNLTALAHYLQENHITGGCYTTRLGVMLASEHQLPVDYLCLGGEKLMASSMKQLFNTSARLINTYGPTECTVNTTYYIIDKNKEYTDIPVGRPLDNMQVFIVDPHGQLLPQGATGELWVAGPQIAAGYCNDEQLTQKKFTACGFCKERVYHTGDLVRWNEEGLLAFVGRTDKQVKRRGYRIELGEIEHALCSIEAVKEAVVVWQAEKLCAYLTTNRPITQETIRQTLRHLLPDYMLPDMIATLKELPLHANGKVDIEKLPICLQTNDTHRYVEPANKREQLLCQAFSKVLQKERVGATDHFFECGGTSLTAMLLLGETEKMKIRLTYDDIFNHPTPRELAQIQHADSSETSITPSPSHNREDCGGSDGSSSFFLTGTTGFLGIHILRELIAHDVQTVYCLVRDKDGMKATERLYDRLRTYFGTHTPLLSLVGNRIQVINGDITSPLRFPPNDIQKISDISLVIHCAADVRYFAQGTVIEDTNITGTENIIRFCIDTNTPLLHISTKSLEDNALHLPFLAKNTPLPYLQSKRVAEELVKKAIRQQGLKAQIIRIGNLMPRQHDGVFQVNAEDNMFIRLLNIIKETGICPERYATFPIDAVPVDIAAKEIVEGNYRGTKKTLLQIAKEWKEANATNGRNDTGSPIRLTSDEEFMQIIRCSFI